MNNLDADSLIRAGREVREPFRLTIVRDGNREEISIQKIFRLLPGRRIVALAESDGQQVLVKVFIGRSARRYQQREVAGAEAILLSGVAAPRLYWQASLAGGYVLGFEYIAGSQNLFDVWRQTESDAARIGLLRKVMPVLARLHAGGVVQNDIHPENFLLSGDHIFTIDGGDVTRRMGRPISEAASLENLALFLAQFEASCDRHVDSLLKDYREARGWTVASGHDAGMLNSICSRREQRKQDYIEKAFRECTRFSCRSSFSRFTVCERKLDSPRMRGLLAGLDRAIDEGRLLKDGNTATVALIDGPSGPLVVKRYNIKNTWHRLARMWRKSRAWVSWANAMRLEFLGISTVTPVALVEERLGPLRGRAYFVAEYIPGPDASHLAEFVNPAEKMLSIAQLLTSLHEAGISHGDLKASNVLLGAEGPVIIDLDSMVEHDDPSTLRAAAMRDLERFMKNWEAEPRLFKQFADLLG